MICDEAKIREVLSQMTLDEKLSLCCGDGKMSTLGVPRLGIAPAKMADGPQGVRIEDKQKSVALPCAISLACTFDRKVAREYGEVLGAETAGDNSQSILGPG